MGGDAEASSKCLSYITYHLRFTGRYPLAEWRFGREPSSVSSRTSVLWKYCNFPLIVAYVLYFGCETTEQTQGGSVMSHPAGIHQTPLKSTSSSANSQVARTRPSSRARGTEVGNFGSAKLVDIGDDILQLRTRMLEERALAEQNNEGCLFVTIQAGCPNCAALAHTIASGALGRAAGRLRVVRIDLDEFEEEVRALNLPIDRVPGFILLDSSGQVEDFLDAGEWDTNDPSESTPVLAKFLQGRLQHRRSMWKIASESRAIEL